MRRIALITLSLAGAAGAAHAQAPFTAEQSAAGRVSYRVNCASCHQSDLRGENEAKPLVGTDFMNVWAERTTDQLVMYSAATMPPAPGTPGSLGREAYVNITAFLLAGRRAGRDGVDGDDRRADRRFRRR